MNKNRLGALVAILVLVLIGQLPAQTEPTGVANFTYLYDIDRPDANLIYCKLVGRSGSPNNNDPIAVSPRIKTTGSNVAVTAQTAGQNPFLNVGVDDVILVTRSSGTKEIRVVATRTDADNITVQTAVDWSAGVTFSYLDTQCGTTDADGWIDTSNFQAKSVTFNLTQISGVTGGIDTRIECMGNALGSQPVIVHPGASGTCAPGTSAGGFCNFTTAGVTTGRAQFVMPSDQVCPRIRFGMRINTSETAETVEADKERITVTLDTEQGK